MRDENAKEDILVELCLFVRAERVVVVVVTFDTEFSFSSVLTQFSSVPASEPNYVGHRHHHQTRRERTALHPSPLPPLTSSLLPDQTIIIFS